jgi:hypothetical protein
MAVGKDGKDGMRSEDKRRGAENGEGAEGGVDGVVKWHEAGAWKGGGAQDLI